MSRSGLELLSRATRLLAEPFFLARGWKHEAKTTAHESKGSPCNTSLSDTQHIQPLILYFWLPSGSLVRPWIRGTVRKFLLLQSLELGCTFSASDVSPTGWLPSFKRSDCLGKLFLSRKMLVLQEAGDAWRADLLFSWIDHLFSAQRFCL